jgi:1-acyl-sn-glycerol-3-phosphate acyltransferase
MKEPVTNSFRYRRRTWLLGLARRLGGSRLLLSLAGCFYHLQVVGEEHLPCLGAVIFAFNHVSPVADGLAYLVVQHRRPQVYLFDMYLVKDEISGLFHALGVAEFGVQQLFVNKRQGLSAEGLLRARQFLLQEEAVAIFPEGEPSWDGRLQYPLAHGAAWLALHTAAPIVPVITRGGYDIQPLWDIEKIRLTGRMSIRIGQPLRFDDAPLKSISDHALQEANQRIWQTMAALGTKASGVSV